MSIGRALSRAGIAAIAAVGLAACGSSGDSSTESAAKASTSTPSPTATAAKAPAGPASVAVADTRLGKILVDSEGRTLYLFKSDSPGRSVCTADYLNCPTQWPPLMTKGSPQGKAGVRADLLGVTRRTKPAGKQVTYKGHPLYLSIEDASPGDLEGQGQHDYWYVVAPSGRAVTAK